MKSDFTKLESLRLQAKKLLGDHASSLKYYEFEGGYGHLNNKKVSVSSTGTCVLSMVTRGLWSQDKIVTKRLIKVLLSKKTSARLEDDNPFTTAWIVESVAALRGFSDELDPEDILELDRKKVKLKEAIKTGGVRIKPYPESGYLTQLVARALRQSEPLDTALEDVVRSWAWSELAKQLTLVQAGSKSQDAFAVGYLLILASMMTLAKDLTPEQSSIQRLAVKVFFECQLPDGSWPLSRPLFHYPETGNAYCYEYEMLTQLLQQQGLTDLLLEHLPKISLAVESALKSGYQLGPGIQVWSSGHHPQLAEPESWSTASVYHFFYELDRLLAEAIRRELFRHLELPMPSVGVLRQKKEDFAPKMLDSFVVVHDQQLSLKQFLWDKFVEPLSRKVSNVSRGIGFDSGIPRSAILFGPPGTSKTKVSEYIADFLGWPFLSIDPSMLLRSGMDGIQVEANSIFRILEQTEKVVVLLDEFDELVLDRADAEQPSRLLTTSMLPKLARIHDAGTIVFIIATNNISRFDLAIKRRGRFDRLIQVMPPSIESKLAGKTWGENKNVDLGKKFEDLRIPIKGDVETQLTDLTFGECNSFATDLAAIEDPLKAVDLLREIHKTCTLQLQAGKVDCLPVNWKKRCELEASLTS